MISKDYLERCAKAVHIAYCKSYKEKNNQEYWTKGDFSKLNDEEKQIDRDIVSAVLDEVQEIARETIKGVVKEASCQK